MIFKSSKTIDGQYAYNREVLSIAEEQIRIEFYHFIKNIAIISRRYDYSERIIDAPDIVLETKIHVYQDAEMKLVIDRLKTLRTILQGSEGELIRSIINDLTKE